jgi:Tol biopolymer transport system component
MRAIMLMLGAATISGFICKPRQDGLSLLTVQQNDAWRAKMSPSSASLSGDGRFIALVSRARLVPADTNDFADIYVLDRTTGSVTLETVQDDGRGLPGDSSHPRLSGDARLLVFETVVPRRSAWPRTDVMIRDRLKGTTERVSRTPSGEAPNGSSSVPAISADGRFVVFTSAATDLVAGADQNADGQDIYLLNLDTRTTERVSVDGTGQQLSSGANISASISHDGRFVAFASGQPVRHIYLRETVQRITSTVTAGVGGHQPDGASWNPAISDDGQYIAFASFAANLVPGDRNRTADVFLYDRAARTITLISRSRAGDAGNGTSANPAISADGRDIAFESEASNLICSRRCDTDREDYNLMSDVFVFDRVTGVVESISGGGRGRWMEESVAPAIDAGGRVIAFSSRHPIDAQDVGNDFDLFVRTVK